MRRFFNLLPYAGVLRQLLWWVALVVPMAVLAGAAVALFLTLLDKVTDYRFAHPWMLFLLPLAGLGIGWVHHRVGGSVEGGNNLILEQIHQPGGGVPRRMAPLILFSTLVTHLFGGSAGREGTAVQMGGSIASTCATWFRIAPPERRMLLMGGLAAGFGAVFGTPLAGAIFAIEVLVIGRMQYEVAVPVLVASLVGDATCRWLGVHHHESTILFKDGLEAALLGKAALAGIAFGLAGWLFCEMQHGIQHLMRRWIAWPPLRFAVGGAMLILLVYGVGTRDYIGLGVHSPMPGGIGLDTAFLAGGATGWSWFWKLLFTAVTLGAGFKGGEVTPLFFVGAMLGNALAWLLGAPVDLFAALGFVAVFAGCAHTPIAGTIMGIELFGAEYAVLFALACYLAHTFSGYTGIYLSQHVEEKKPLREERQRRHGELLQRVRELGGSSSRDK